MKPSVFKTILPLILMGAILLVLIIGGALGGQDFLNVSLVKGGPARVWISFNGFLSVIGMVSVYRSIWRFREHWTWQELAFFRGVFMLLFGGSIGNFTRVFSSGPINVSIGTPLITIGILTIVYGVLRPPVRLKEHH